MKVFSTKLDRFAHQRNYVCMHENVSRTQTGVNVNRTEMCNIKPGAWNEPQIQLSHSVMTRKKETQQKHGTHRTDKLKTPQKVAE